MDGCFYNGLQFRPVIISQGRAQRISTHRLVRGATLVVPSIEAGRYAVACEDRVAEVVSPPANLRPGISALRNWVLSRYDEQVIFFLPDDLSALWCNAREAGYGISDYRVIR